MSRSSADKSRKSENVKVAVRCRPLNSAEKERGDAVSVVVNRAAGSISVSRGDDGSEPARQFTFDLTYGSEAEQLAIYEEAARPIVDSVLQGYNGTIFACHTTGRRPTAPLSSA
jgi:kinesin family protein 3/17